MTDADDLMIINKSGIVIRMVGSELRVMGRATQVVRLVTLKGKAENLGIEPLKEVLAKTRQTWLNTDQTIKKMIQRHKAGKKVSVKYKGEVYEGLKAIEIMEKYVAFLMDKAEKENRRVAFILMKNTQK